MFSFFLPGLGQLYAGSPSRAWKALLATIVLSFSLLLCAGLLLRTGFKGFVALLFLGQLINLLIAFDALRQARLAKLQTRPSYDRWWVYLIIYLSFEVCTTLLPRLIPQGALAETIAPHTNWRAFYLPSGSMLPTMGVGDYVIADTTPRSDWRRGDILVFRTESSPQPLVKRLLGTPGDSIEFRDGDVFVNDERFQPDYWSEKPDSDFPPFVVPADHYFVVGDNINNSRDSRYIGPVDRENIIGLLLYRFWGREIGTEFVDLSERQ